MVKDIKEKLIDRLKNIYHDSVCFDITDIRKIVNELPEYEFTPNLVYRYINADENAEMAKKLNIRRAPTLVVKVGDKVLRIDNVSDIRKFVENKTA